MKKFIGILAGVAAMLSACGQVQTEDFTSYVDPKIGSGGNGHVFVGANVHF